MRKGGKLDGNFSKLVNSSFVSQFGHQGRLCKNLTLTNIEIIGLLLEERMAMKWFNFSIFDSLPVEKFQSTLSNKTCCKSGLNKETLACTTKVEVWHC